jgi:hypothetical protein
MSEIRFNSVYLVFTVFIFAFSHFALAQNTSDSEPYNCLPQNNGERLISQEERDANDKRLTALLQQIIDARQMRVGGDENRNLQDSEGTDDDRIRSYYETALEVDRLEGMTFFCPAAGDWSQRAMMSDLQLETLRNGFKEQGFAWAENPLGDSTYGESSGLNNNRNEIMGAYSALSTIYRDQARVESCDNEAERLGIQMSNRSPLNIFANRTRLSEGSLCRTYIEETVLGQTGTGGGPRTEPVIHER